MSETNMSVDIPGGGEMRLHTVAWYFEHTTKRTISAAGTEFAERMWDENHKLGNIAGEFMSLNVEYVINHHGENETQKTLDILKTGYTKNQKRFLERLAMVK